MSYDSVDHFLRAAARVPLLTADEEIILGRSVQQMLALKQSSPDGPYSKAEQRTIKRGERAKERFINANLRLVASVASKYYHSKPPTINMLYEDMIQEGNLGLIRAVEKFDPERGYKFSTYAYWWIRQGIVRGMHMGGRAVRLPVHIHEKLYALNRMHFELAAKLGRNPTTQELADATQIDREQLEHALMVSANPSSLNVILADDGNQLLDVIGDGSDADQQLEQVSHSMDMDRLRDAMRILPQRDQEILEARFGMAGGEPETLSAIAKRHGLTRERVRQRCANALRKVESRLLADPQFRLSPEWKSAA